MGRKIRVAAIGDNCIDYYDSLNESYPGGNPVNVAVYIKRLGGESSYTGAVGTDSFGKIMISAIQNKGVDTSHIQVLDGKTAVTHVDIVDGDRVFGKYEEGVLADFKLREQDISFIKKHDLAVTGIWGMIEDELPLISKEIPVAFDFANKFANPIVEKAIPYVTYAFFSFDEESRNEFRQKYHSMGLKEKENCTEQLKEFMKAMQQKGPKVIIATLGKNGSIGYDGNSWYRFGIIECKVVDTMGAGDSFIAGFLYGILNGLNVQDDVFIQSIKNTFFYFILQVPIMLVVAMVLACILNKKDLRFKGFFRTMIFLPCTTSLVAYSIIFRSLFANDGLVNYVLVNLGILDKPYNFLTQPFAAKMVIILALLWRWTGYNMVFFLSGLQNIEYSVYEAAKIDGASAIQTFFKITVPLLKPTILLTAIMSTNGTLQLFDESINLTDGGPANASISMSHYIYNLCFKYVPNFGYAAAMSFFILLLVAVLAFIQMRVGDKRD